MYRRDLGRAALTLGAAAIGKPSIGIAQEPLPQLPPGGSLGLALNIPFGKIVNPSLTYNTLKDLGSKLRPAKGWNYRVAVLDKEQP